MDHASFTLREVKLAPNPGDMTFTGYGAVFDNVDSYGDVIVRGAFADTIAQAKAGGSWPAMLMQHGGLGIGADDMTPVGIWTDMEEDSIGLKLSGKLADTVRGREAYALLKMEPRPAIDGLSIGYVAKTWEARSKPDDPRRKLTKVDLLEVSLVTFPANPKARIGSVKASGLTIRAFEMALESGTLPPLSARQAKALLSGGFKAMTSARDAGDDTDATAALERLLHTIRA